MEFGFRKSLLSLRLPNIEYNLLTRRDSLDTLIQYNPSLRYILNTGLVTSMTVNYSIAGGKREGATNLTRTNLEVSGLLTGLIRNRALHENLYRFVKLDAEHRR